MSQLLTEDPYEQGYEDGWTEAMAAIGPLPTSKEF